jgi:hypothetical protein
MKSFTWLAVFAAAWAGVAARAEESPAWSAYLDYAYVYSSAEPEALRARLEEYGREAGVSLEDYIAEHFEGPGSQDFDERALRRKAIAYLLHYLAFGEPDSLEASVDTVRQLEDRLGRHENRYWYHYVLAHRALEEGQRFDFVGEMLDLWLHVVVPLEAPYETLQTLSLSDAPNSGFVAALPYIYENVARLVLIRSQEMGLDRSLDPLAAIVRMLHDGRVGAYPDVIPPEASSREYVERIVERLDGPESDGGSLTFTLALFEAAKYHDQARSLLASEGFSQDTLRAIRIASGAYEAALHRADTIQGQAAVYTRVLRQLGEVYAAKQRLGVDPDVESPFSIEGAIDVYASLHDGGQGDGWAEIGYRRNGRQAWIDAMHGLWEEIQESILNAADSYLSKSLESPHLAAEHSRHAARLYARYLSFFQDFATSGQREGVPDSAYFAAHEAARGYGDALLGTGAVRPKPEEVRMAVRRYVDALRIFPFDWRIWSRITASLERQGQESRFLDLVRPVAEAVTRSRHVNAWIENGEPGAEQIATLRRALSDSLAIMHLGFAEAGSVDELEEGLDALRERRNRVEQELISLTQQRDGVAADDADFPAAPAPEAEPARAPLDARGRAELERRIQEKSALLERLERQIAARSRALPLYKAALQTDDLARQLRVQRDHPVHTLLRRMYHESQ